MTRTLLHSLIALSMTLTSASLCLADHDNGKGKGHDDDDDARPGERPAVLFNAPMLRVADIPGGLGVLPGGSGTDPLQTGQVEVHLNRHVNFELRGAPANATFDVLFCRFGQNTCVNMVPATLTTKSEGKATVECLFPASETRIAGVFVLTRNGALQYASGLGFPVQAAPVIGVEIELEGNLNSINTVNMTFQLASFAIDIKVTPDTKLKGFNQFNDLRVAQRVEVKGVASGGQITATEIRLK